MAAPNGQSAPGPVPVPGRDATEHDVFALTVPVVVQLPPSHVVDDVAVTFALICVVNIVLSVEMHWLTSLALT